MSANMLSADFGVTMVLTETELSMYAPAKPEQELSSAYSRIANLEDTLDKLRVTHTSLSTRFLKLQRDHVRVEKENRRLQEEKLSNSSTFPETITEIIALRKQLSDVTEHLKQAEQTGVYWQLRYENQQEVIDKYARCVDEMQVELRSKSNNQKG
jgi:predicted  nucleic acid-binding Zn-ribbon protein